jgi:putative aminopeptidase FrvX
VTESLGSEHHEIIQRLSRCPATSFHEYLVSREIQNILLEGGIQSIEDKYGNIISRVEGKTSKLPPIAFVAHMDHPGFETTISKNPIRTIANALGGVPVAVFHGRRTSAFSFDKEGNRSPCELVAFGGPEERKVEVLSSHPLSPGSPIVFDLPDLDVGDGQVRMRALDDIAGCASIISAMQEIKKYPSDTDVFAIFTRAEEVGLIGAKLLSQSNVIPKDTIMVSVETSSVIPGVIQGAGPIIRTGDASFTFNADAERVLIRARHVIQEAQPDFLCQRQLMSAGSCEASAFAASGFRSTGIAFPLGNWHNATASISDARGDIAAEYISLSDYTQGIKLIEMSARSVSPKIDGLIARLQDVPDGYRERLEATK